MTAEMRKEETAKKQNIVVLVTYVNINTPVYLKLHDNPVASI